MPRHRFTIYDVLEQKGYFDSNPANSQSRDKVDGHSLYSGPIEYPKMLYHPDGEEKVISQGEMVQRGNEFITVGVQKELLHQIVQNKAEDEVLAAEGWHDHPSKAVRRRVELFIEASPNLSEKERQKLLKTIPSMSSASRILDLEAELAKLTKQVQEEREQRARDTAPVQASASAQPAVQGAASAGNQFFPSTASAS